MEFDAAVVCRLQFGLTASYHVIFPSLIIGLTAYLFACEAVWQVRRDPCHREQYLFWAKVLAPTFLVAVITGLVLAHQLDHVFTGFYDATKAVFLPIRETEVIATMALEMGFFVTVVWGWRQVGDRLHFLSTCLFATGVAIAAVCILGRNSWMQTPSGFEMVDGEIHLVDWFTAVLSPSFPFRFAHMIGAAILSTGMLILAVCSWFLLRGQHPAFARRGLRNAVLIVGILAPVQVLSGHMHGLNTRDHQPAKLAAMEGLWETTRGAPFLVFAIPDTTSQQNRWEVAIPKMASVLIAHEPDGEVFGLSEVREQDRPNVLIVFFAFRVMLLCGLLMIGLGLVGLILLWRGRLFENRWFLRAGCSSFPVGFIAVIAGWCVTEAGRQPWVAHGLVRTADVIDPGSVVGCEHSLRVILFSYLGLLALFIGGLTWIISRGPTDQPA